MNGPVKDEVGTLESKDGGTTTAEGMAGPARHFAGRQGIFCGDKITNYPSGSSPHSAEAWFRTEKPNTTIIAWGNEQGQGKVVMQFRSPPHISVDCYFSDGKIKGNSTLPMSQWTHVVHTYQKGRFASLCEWHPGRSLEIIGASLAIKSPARLWIGGWYNNYEFIGDIDEVRISKVVRSADWIRLQYENQKPLQTLVGLMVQSGNIFSVSPEAIQVAEGKSATISASAGGAQKVYWILKRDGRESVVAVDRFSYTFEAGRVGLNPAREHRSTRRSDLAHSHEPTDCLGAAIGLCQSSLPELRTALQINGELILLDQRRHQPQHRHITLFQRDQCRSVESAPRLLPRDAVAMKQFPVLNRSVAMQKILAMFALGPLLGSRPGP